MFELGLEDLHLLYKYSNQDLRTSLHLEIYPWCCLFTVLASIPAVAFADFNKHIKDCPPPTQSIVSSAEVLDIIPVGLFVGLLGETLE